jgi:hypothetical protein
MREAGMQVVNIPSQATKLARRAARKNLQQRL